MKFQSQMTPLLVREGRVVSLLSEQQVLDFSVLEHKHKENEKGEHQLFLKMKQVESEDAPQSFLIKWDTLGVKVQNFIEAYSFSFTLEDIEEKNKVLFMYRSPQGLFEFLIEPKAFAYESGKTVLKLSYVLWQGETPLQRVVLSIEDF